MDDLSVAAAFKQSLQHWPVGQLSPQPLKVSLSAVCH